MQDDYPDQAQPTKKIRNIIIFAVLAFVLIGLVILAYSRAFIVVEVEGVKNSSVSYRLTDQKTGASTTIKNESGSLKKMVARGSYEVLVSQGETSYFQALDTGSFFATANIKAQLRPEKVRSFVGTNPASCMHYNQTLLFSYNCDDSFDSLKVHLPATADIPTITQTAGTGLGNLPIGGLARIDGKSVLLLNNLAPGDGDEGGSSSLLGELNENLELNNTVVPSGSAKEKPYKILPFLKGFVLYDAELKDVLYYDKLGAKSEKISFEAPKDDDEDLQPFELVAHGDRLAAIYSTVSGSEESSQDQKRTDGETKITEGKTVFQVYGGGKTKSFVFDSGYTRAQLCGQKYLCVINGPTLTVYDITGSEQKELFSINGVRDVLNDGDKLVVVRERDVLGFDIERRSGHVQYGFGKYSPCGNQNVQGGGYLLCMVNPAKNTQAALYINTKQDNTDSIDKKVLSLASKPYIDTVSIYKNYIYIVPELGELVYNPATNGYGPDPTTRQKAASSINGYIKDLAIDQSKYTIINTQP